MFTALSSAVSGLDNYQEQMDIIGNNIANLNTTGFKSVTGNLADSFSDTLQAATSTDDGITIGTGVLTTSTTNDWSNGVINPTGIASNLAINGNGFFIVEDPVSNAQYVTQDGTFSVNSSGNLITATGDYVMGTTAGGTSLAPIVIAPPTGSTASVLSYSFSSLGNNLYSNMANAGPLTTAGTPGSGSLGTIQAGALELSNVDLSAQMADLIVAQRAFEANSKMITTSDEVLEDVVNMKH